MSEENTSDVSQEEVKIVDEMEVVEVKAKDATKEEDTKKESEEEEPATEEVTEEKISAKKEEIVENEIDEEPQLGLLERPVVIESGKREKKKVERLEMSATAAHEKKTVVIPEGIGEKLGDSAIIEYQLNRVKAEDLKVVHRALFDRPGSVLEIKRNIRKFNGFDYGKDDKRFEKKRMQLSKITTTHLKKMCEILGLERSGPKEDLLTKIMDFLVEPKGSGKSVPISKRKRKSGEGKSKTKVKKEKKRAASPAAASTKKKKTTPVLSSASSSSDPESEEEEEVVKVESESSSESEQQSEESEEEEVVKKVKKKKKSKGDKKTSKKEKKNEKKEKEKKEKEKKEKEKKEKETPKKKIIIRKRKISESTSDSSDDEPIIKKKKIPPSDDELHEDVKKILEGANLEEVTMKTVLKQVYAKYPDFDLTPRKEFIKSTVKQIIS